MTKLTVALRNFANAPKKPVTLDKVKGKAIPLQAWTGPEGSGLPDFKTIGT